MCSSPQLNLSSANLLQVFNAFDRVHVVRAPFPRSSKLKLPQYSPSLLLYPIPRPVLNRLVLPDRLNGYLEESLCVFAQAGTSQ
jgi:hypothetical protein